MLDGCKIIAFAATVDGTKCRAFYHDVLGLDFISEDDFSLVFDANGIELRIQKLQTFAPQTHTQLGWSVSSIEQLISALRTRGAVFETCPFLQQSADGIWTAPSGAKIAWLKDPDGNLLSLPEPKRG